MREYKPFSKIYRTVGSDYAETNGFLEIKGFKEVHLLKSGQKRNFFQLKKI
jgi:hypothetical protein